MSPAALLAIAAASILLLLVLVIRFKIQAFVALLLVSFGVGLAAGVSPLDVIEAITTGMGDTLGFVAIVVGLGTMIGRFIQESRRRARSRSPASSVRIWDG